MIFFPQTIKNIPPVLFIKIGIIAFVLANGCDKEGNENHPFNATCNTVAYPSTNSPFTKQVDNSKRDGETATIEFKEPGVLFLNINTEYVEELKLTERVLLGELYIDNICDVYDS